MGSLQCLIATTQRQIDDALRVRWTVFGSELGFIASAPSAPREVSCFDTLETTLHFVVYADERPVATARLLLPNAEVARATGHPLGIDLEQKFDLSAIAASGLSVAETTRYCVLRAWRGSEVLVRLNAAMYQESRRRGVTHWIASGNTETDSLEDARLAWRVAAREGLVSQRWSVQSREPSPELEAPRLALYTPEQRLRAQAGQLQGLRLPRTLGLFARKMGARFIGEPIYDAHFRMCSMPLVAALDEIPSSTLAQFEAVTSGLRRAA
jgi:putative hemolysin